MRTTEQEEKIVSNAHKVACRYARSTGWRDAPDVVQVAALAQLESAKRFDPERGVPFGAFMWSVATLSAKNYLLDRAPVTYKHRRDELKNVTSEPAFGDSGENPRLVAQGDLQDRLDRASLVWKVRERLRVLMGDDGADFALAALTGEWTAQEIARENGVPAAQVYEAMVLTRRILRNDAELLELWEQW